MNSVQSVPTGQLLTNFRDVLMKLAGDRTDRALARQADAYEEEILRRMAW